MLPNIINLLTNIIDLCILKLVGPTDYRNKPALFRRRLKLSLLERKIQVTKKNSHIIYLLFLL